MSGFRGSMSKNFGSSSEYNGSMSRSFGSSSEYNGSVSRSFGSSDFKVNMSGNFGTQSLSLTDQCRSFSTDNRKEKNELTLLNNNFATLINQVITLEDEKMRLKEQLKILNEYTVFKGEVDEVMKQEKLELEHRVSTLLYDKEKLQAEKTKYLQYTEDTKKRFEEEQKKTNKLEADCINKKETLDHNVLENVRLMLELNDLEDKLDFLKAGFAKEIMELESQIQNEHVILPGNNKHSLDKDTVEIFRLLYENMSKQISVEVEQRNKAKIEFMTIKTKQQEAAVSAIKRDIKELLRQIKCLQEDIESNRRTEKSLKMEINMVEEDTTEDKAHKTIVELEEALKHSKQKLDELIQQQQSQNKNMWGLGFEIFNYGNLLEGEEQRIGNAHQRPRNAGENHLSPLRIVKDQKDQKVYHWIKNPTPGRAIVSLPGGQGISTTDQMVIQTGVTQEIHRVEKSYYTED